MTIEICVIGPDRAGTTHFCTLFENLSNVFTTKNRQLYEIFKRGKLTDVENVGQIIKETNKISMKQLQKHPNRKRIYVDAWKQSTKQQGKEYLLYKIIYHQLKPREFKRFFRSNQKQIKIIITRNLLDMYISQQKARKIKKWRDSDTSNIKIHFNKNENFDEWSRIRTRYMKKLKKHLDQRNYKYLVIDYDELHTYANDQEKLNYILKRIQNELGYNLLMNQSISIKSGMKKQDHAKSYRDKVVNYTEMRKLLKGRNLELKKIFN